MKTGIQYVRWSTDQQSEGDSERRQLETGKTWFEAKGIKPTRIFTDSGVSGGKRSRPQLDQLLEYIKTTKTDYCVVYDIDRLSRLSAMDALKLVEEILEHGLTLVSVRDGQFITKENWQSTSVFLPLTLKASLAAEERQKRIANGKQAWIGKRLKIKDKPLTAKAYPWLKLENGKWTIVEAVRQDVVKLFELASSGYGIRRILKENVLSRNYSTATVYSWLTSTAVLGHFTPRSNVEGKRIEVGETIKDYYPAIIPEDLFYLVQKRLKERIKLGGRSKTGLSTNLFSGLGTCVACGGSIIMYGNDKHRYLVCNNGFKYAKCTSATIPYQSMEGVFEWILEANAASYIQDKPPITTDRIDYLKKQLVKYTETLQESGTASKTLGRLIAESEQAIEVEEGKLEALKVEQRSTSGSVEEILDIISNDMTGENRMKVKLFIRDLVESMVVDTKAKHVSISFKNGTVTGIQFTDKHCYWFKLNGEAKERPAVVKLQK